MKEKKSIIIILMIVAIFYILVSSRILPSVILPYYDACIICTIIAIVTLSLRVLSKIEIKNLERKLIRQQSQLTAIINNCPFVVYLKSVDGKIILANEVTSELSSLDTEKLIGMCAYNLIADPTVCKSEDAELLKNKEIITCERYEKFANGKSHWVRIVRVPILDEKDNISSIVVIFRVIDDVKDLEDRKNSFIATLTHDLKTPTIAQIRALDLFLNEAFGAISEEQKLMLEQIKHSCQYMYDLIFTILDTYIYDNGLTKINPVKFNMQDLINETIRGLSNLLSERNQKLRINVDLESSNIVADKLQLKRVIINLFSNAITHGFKNSEIEVFVGENDENMKFEIKNKSEYIAEGQMKEIFEKYKHKENSKSMKTSTGLGLYLSKQIIDAHNGRMYAHSDEDQNCVFGFEIPKNTSLIELNSKESQTTK